MRKRKSNAAEQPLLLTSDQACSLLQVGRDTLRGLIKSGQLQAISLGRSVRISRQALETFVAARSQSSKAS